MIIPTRIKNVIYQIRGQRVILDEDLAELYEVSTKALVQAVKRNQERFPADFFFVLSEAESRAFRLTKPPKKGRGGRRSAPYAFTEQGVAMASSVLNSKRAILVNVEIIRTFVKLRQALASNDFLMTKLAELENRYDSKFKVVFDAIRALTAPATKARPIGFAREEKS